MQTNVPTTNKEKAYSDAWWDLYNEHIINYIIDKESNSDFSVWKEHKDSENQYEYWEVQYHNQNIIDERFSSFCDELDLIVNQIIKNPSRELTERKIIRLEKKFTDSKEILLDSIQYILTNIENKYLANLGYSDAWIYLDEYLEQYSEKNKTPIHKSKIIHTPNWGRGDFNRFIIQLKNEGFIKQDYSISDLKECFLGKPIDKVSPIIFEEKIPNSTKVQLIDHLDKLKLIDKCTQDGKAHIIGVKKDDYKNTLYRQKMTSQITLIQEVRRIVYSVSSLMPK